MVCYGSCDAVEAWDGRSEGDSQNQTNEVKNRDRNAELSCFNGKYNNGSTKQKGQI
jgi:hypothetical protein